MMSDFVQYDTSDTLVGGVNLTEAIQSDKKLIFNESYTVIGECLSASSVYGCYDLTVIGNVEVDNIEIRGTFFVKGNIKAKQISCAKAIICGGDITSKAISADDITANNIICNVLSCFGNVIVHETIDVREKLQTDKSVLAGEGIIGTGEFVSQNAVATEYFEFSGEVAGKAIELETNSTFGMANQKEKDEKSLDDLVAELKVTVSRELAKAGEIDEDQLITLVEHLSGTDRNMVFNWMRLITSIIEISYQDKIANLREYLYVIMAKKILPVEIIEYETVEHVFRKMLAEAEEQLESLPYFAKTVEELAYSIEIVNVCEQEIKLEKDEMLDYIFQSIGIKYRTVRSYLR